MNNVKYFCHDVNARSDIKIINLQKKYGLLGYGIYFCLVEMLCSQKKYILKTDFELLAFELKEDAKIIEDVIKNYGLFVVSGGYFYSNSLKRRMQVLDKIIESRKKGGKKRWEKNKKSQPELMEGF